MIKKTNKAKMILIFVVIVVIIGFSLYMYYPQLFQTVPKTKPEVVASWVSPNPAITGEKTKLCTTVSDVVPLKLVASEIKIGNQTFVTKATKYSVEGNQNSVCFIYTFNSTGEIVWRIQARNTNDVNSEIRVMSFNVV